VYWDERVTLSIGFPGAVTPDAICLSFADVSSSDFVFLSVSVYTKADECIGQFSAPFSLLRQGFPPHPHPHPPSLSLLSFSFFELIALQAIA
jgi:hypothetical protein